MFIQYEFCTVTNLFHFEEESMFFVEVMRLTLSKLLVFFIVFIWEIRDCGSRLRCFWRDPGVALILNYNVFMYLFWLIAIWTNWTNFAPIFASNSRYQNLIFDLFCSILPELMLGCLFLSTSYSASSSFQVVAQSDSRSLYP